MNEWVGGCRIKEAKMKLRYVPERSLDLGGVAGW